MSLDDEIFDDGRIPPEDPPVKKGGLNWWQKAVIGVSIPIILTAGYFGINALVNRQYKPVSTPTPVATSTYTPQPTPTITQVPTQTPTATPIPGLENILSEDEVLDYVASFQPNQEVTKEVLGRIDAINKTYYFGFTRNTFESGKFVTKFLTVKEYMALWNQPGGTLPNSLGSTAKLPNGETVIYINVDAAYVKEDGPLSILLNTVRETANAEAERRSLRNYELGIKDVKAFRKEVSEKYNLGDISDLNLPWIERERAFYPCISQQSFIS